MYIMHAFYNITFLCEEAYITQNISDNIGGCFYLLGLLCIYIHLFRCVFWLVMLIIRLIMSSFLALNYISEVILFN